MVIPTVWVFFPVWFLKHLFCSQVAGWMDGALCLAQFLRKCARKGVLPLCVESKGHGFDVTNFESFHMICEFGVDICVGVETG